MRKKFVSKLILALALNVFCAVSFGTKTAMAASGTTYECKWNFDETTGTLTISGTGEMPRYGVEKPAPWSAYSSSIKKVVIGDGVKNVGESAFEDYTALAEVTIGSDVKTIESSAFSGTAISGITLPDSVSTIESYAFYDCTQLKNAALGSVSVIESYAFANTALTEITVPSAINSIGVCALGYIDYGDGDESPVAGFTIKGYTGSAAETYAKQNSFTFVSTGTYDPNGKIGKCKWKFSVSDGTLTISGTGSTEDEDIFTEDDIPWHKYRSDITKAVIEDGVEDIIEDAFCDCTNLKSASIGNNVKVIGEEAFSGSGLESITIPASVETIKYHAFKQTKLTQIVIPDTVKTFESSICFNCEDLACVTVGNGVSEIAQDDFSDCPNLVTVNIGSNVKKIGLWAFAGDTALTEITIPGNVETITEQAFWGCENLSSVRLGSGVKVIGNSAFENTALKEITVPLSVTEIQDYAFGYNYDDNRRRDTAVKGFTVKGYSGSAAQTYAQKNNFTFVAVNLQGDVDGDCYITDNDAALLLKHIAGILPITDEAVLKRSDMNTDDKQDMIDVISILKEKTA